MEVEIPRWDYKTGKLLDVFDTFDALILATAQHSQMASLYTENALPMAEEASSSRGPSGVMKCLTGPIVHTFTGIQELLNMVNRQSDLLVNGKSTDQYLNFSGVTISDLEEIDKNLHSIGRHCRMSYEGNENRLCIKLIPSRVHEVAHLFFTKTFENKQNMMGIKGSELLPMGAGRTAGTHGNSKEPDSSFLPTKFRTMEDWPSFVIEVGVSESLRKLRLDARWWLEESEGEAKLALIFAIDKPGSSLLIEKWEPSTRARQQEQSVLVQSVSATPTVVRGAPLVLEFSKIFLRPPVPPEADFHFTRQEISELASFLW